MKVLVCVLSIWIFMKNISYAIYECKENKNVSGGVIIAVFNVICVIFANVVLFLA